MSIFLSHSSRDSDKVSELVEHLESAGHTVWLDKDLVGGEAWWAAILEQIRGCKVFVLALSTHSLQSQPCRAELDYADKLGVPVLPVQIEDVETRRVNPVFTRQLIDFRQPTTATGIALMRALGDCVAHRPPLPDPLPPSPPIPFEYLLKLGKAIEGPDPISPHDQASIVGQLDQALDDEQDESVRDDIRGLLQALRRRTEVTYATVNQIDEVLKAAKDRPVPQPDPGWYADPAGNHARMRYWDGAQWTDHYYNRGAAGRGSSVRPPVAPVFAPRPHVAPTAPRPSQPTPQPQPATPNPVQGGAPPVLHPTPTPTPTSMPPGSYVPLAIVAILLCFPLGIPALVNSTRVSSLWAQGDYDNARRASANARNFAIAAVVIGVVVFIIYIIAAGASSNTRSSY